MDAKSLLSCASSFEKPFKEAPCSVANSPFKLSGLGRGVNAEQDALEAVKLDPAVLEAQVTVYTKKNTSDTDAKNVTADTKNVSEVVEEDNVSASPTPPKSFEVMVKEHEAALLSLTPQQLELLMNYADVLRRQRMVAQRQLECAFCKSNGKPLFWYTSHALKDWRGRVRCPILRAFRCPRCGATGDRAHTIKYCPDIETKSSCSRNSSI